MTPLFISFNSKLLEIVASGKTPMISPALRALSAVEKDGAPILPTIIWGSQRIWTKGMPRNFSRAMTPISISVGKPFQVERDSAIEGSLEILRHHMGELLSNAQNDYPDSPIGQRWAPARLGGTAPTPEMVELESQKRKEI